MIHKTFLTLTRKILPGLLVLLQALLAQAGVTDLATVPLDMKSSVEPNIIFALDDSGSMGFEILIKASDGALWWSGTAKNFTDASGKPLFNATGTAGFDGSTTWYKYAYLFPNGTAADARDYGDSTNDHFAVPPIAAYAWLRSSDYNPLYYNPAITYKPWTPGYISGASRSFAAATPTAARSHPWLPASGSPVTINLTATQSSAAINWTFRMYPGMVIPGATISGITGSKNGSGFNAVSTNYTIPVGEVWNVNIPYYPATYWVKDAGCTSGASCALAPDGARLRRYEIKSGNTFPSGRSYADELQNFANWFQYYRKRILMLSSAASASFSQVAGLRVGITKLNNLAPVTMWDLSSTDTSKNVQALLGVLYATAPSGGTPTRAALNYVGQQFMRADSSAPIQYACQTNAAFVMTDGFAQASGPTVPSYDKSAWVGAPPYATIHANSLADIAAYYYTTNLRSDLPAGQISFDPASTASNADKNPNLHMNTYALSLGALGTIYGTGSPQALNPYLNYPAWPNPSVDRNPTAIDDLWHATLNGRGYMLNANSPDTVAAALKNILADVLVKAGGEAALAVSNVNLRAGDSTAYVSSYSATYWSGDVAAYPVDPATGGVTMTDAARLWSAAVQLDAKPWTSRLIATYNNGGVPFEWANLASSQQAVLNTPDQSDGALVLNWLRGDRSLEGSPYRVRAHVLGDAVDAEPVLVSGAAGSYSDAGYAAFSTSLASRNRVIYQAANDGMLHAFEASSGNELWAYIPSFVEPNLQKFSASPYAHQFTVNGTPGVGDVDFSNTQGGSGAPDWRTLLVGGLSRGGMGYYALDISSPAAASESQVAAKVLWEFPNASTPAATRNNMGYSYGRPVIVKTKAAGWVVLVTSGYNNTAGDGKGHLFVLDPKNGQVISDLATGTGSTTSPSGLAQVSAWAVNPGKDGMIDSVYGGDLQGNLWRFDLSGAATGSWAVARLATFTYGGAAQPISAAPELTTVGGKRLVIVGTGQLLGVSDYGNTAVESMYAVVDTQQADPPLTSPRTQLKQKVVTVGAGGVRSINGDKVDLNAYRGWFFDLPGAGERANTSPTAVFGEIVFTANQPSATACQSSSYLYAVGQDTGGQMPNNYFASGTIPWSGKSLGQNLANRSVVVVTTTGKVVSLTHASDNSVVGTQLPSYGTAKLTRRGWKEVVR